MDAFGDYLCERIRTCGLTLRGLGRLARVGHTTLSRLIGGKLRPTPAILLAIAPHLRVSAWELFARAGLRCEALQSRWEALDQLGMSVDLDADGLRAQVGRLAEAADAPEGRRLILEGFCRKMEELRGRGPIIERLQELYDLYRDSGADGRMRRVAGGALLYFIQSLDHVEDDLFPVGYLDDALVVALAWQEVHGLRGGRARSQ